MKEEIRFIKAQELIQGMLERTEKEIIELKETRIREGQASNPTEKARAKIEELLVPSIESLRE
ncbi:MAG: hypothetical protein AB1467_05790 [Candidatus Diapherotrites archaeon]